MFGVECNFSFGKKILFSQAVMSDTISMVIPYLACSNITMIDMNSVRKFVTL